MSFAEPSESLGDWNELREEDEKRDKKLIEEAKAKDKPVEINRVLQRSEEAEKKSK